MNVRKVHPLVFGRVCRFAWQRCRSVVGDGRYPLPSSSSSRRRFATNNIDSRLQLFNAPRLMGNGLIPISYLGKVANWNIYQRFYNNNFNIHQFLEGAEQAHLTIAQAIGTSNVAELKDMVTPSVLDDLSARCSQLTSAEREHFLGLSHGDLYWSCPYWASFGWNDNGADRTFIIHAVVWSAKNIDSVKRKVRERFRIQIATDVLRRPHIHGDPSPFLSYFHEDVLISNSVFVTKVGTGQCEWSINRLNFFQPPSKIKFGLSDDCHVCLV